MKTNFPPTCKTVKSSISSTLLQQIILLPAILLASVSTFPAVTHAQNVDLGILTGFNPQSSFVPFGNFVSFQASGAFDQATTNSGWGVQNDFEEYLQWRFNPYQNVEIDPELLDEGIQFTLDIYSGLNLNNGAWGDIHTFSLYAANENGNFFRVVDYESLTTTVPSITSDENGLITATDSQPGVQVVHSIVFNMPNTVRNLRLVVPAATDTDNSELFLINEIITSAETTMAVPEPSTYALFLGLSFITLHLFRRKK